MVATKEPREGALVYLSMCQLTAVSLPISKLLLMVC